MCVARVLAGGHPVNVKLLQLGLHLVKTMAADTPLATVANYCEPCEFDGDDCMVHASPRRYLTDQCEAQFHAERFARAVIDTGGGK